MPNPEPESLIALRKALGISPDNLPLKKLYAGALLEDAQYAQAENEYRALVDLLPTDFESRVGLAKAFFQQNKLSHALALVEVLIKETPSNPDLTQLYSKLLHQAGEKDHIQQSSSDGQKIPLSFQEESEFDVENKDLGSFEEKHRFERPKIKFSDVGGMELIKEEMRQKIIFPIEHPDLYKSYGKSAGGGILLFGPPGCGKTYLSRAIAGEIKAQFICVGIHEILDMWIGNSEKNMHELFQYARRNTPCILFFDEIDALGASRSDMRHSASRQIINQFLAEMDGAQSDNEGILILGATNSPWQMDSAFLRPGRFDRVLFVPPPDLEAREAILKIHLSKKPTAKLDVSTIAKKAEDYSGADLRALVDKAVESKIQASIKAGSALPIEMKDLQEAFRVIKPTTRDWLATARNYAVHANQSGIYDPVIKYLKL